LTGEAGISVGTKRQGRRRTRQQDPRRNRVEFSLTDDEYADVRQAAGQAGLARGAYAAQAVVAAARGTGPGGDLLPRQALGQLIRAAGLVRRIGVNLNQAVARLNATGEHAGDLAAYAAESMRRARHLDAAAEAVRDALP
jgi:hypothetical protein